MASEFDLRGWFDDPWDQRGRDARQIKSWMDSIREGMAGPPPQFAAPAPEPGGTSPGLLDPVPPPSQGRPPQIIDPGGVFLPPQFAAPMPTPPRRRGPPRRGWFDHRGRRGRNPFSKRGRNPFSKMNDQFKSRLFSKAGKEVVERWMGMNRPGGRFDHPDWPPLWGTRREGDPFPRRRGPTRTRARGRFGERKRINPYGGRKGRRSRGPDLPFIEPWLTE